MSLCNGDHCSRIRPSCRETSCLETIRHEVERRCRKFDKVYAYLRAEASDTIGCIDRTIASIYCDYDDSAVLHTRRRALNSINWSIGKPSCVCGLHTMLHMGHRINDFKSDLRFVDSINAFIVDARERIERRKRETERSRRRRFVPA